ncbi:hypothetical protein POM88_045974 [Heracleum sosnowskyi]|uniref:Uncharacterized protein n=1 Tax=Heracleum sosnowskyi TaxID=360622 RepID=A0AAD8M497_9APIA|nr:hypothetical protein POM88_045974 [Heracleum sosnowskyi]
MTAWLEENLKAYTKQMGEWCSRSYQRDDMNTFFNPLICISTEISHRIKEKMKVKVKRKLYEIYFEEVNLLKGKVLPMETSDERELNAELVGLQQGILSAKEQKMKESRVGFVE